MDTVDYLLILKGVLPFLKEIVLLIFGAIGSYVALQGLNTWKRQLKGKDEYELCKKVLIDLYKYNNSIKVVRNPAMFQYEYENPNDTIDFSDKEKLFRNKTYAYQERWKKVEENRSKLNLSIMESKVYWDDNLEELFNPIFEFENKLFYAVQDQLLMSNPNQDDEYKKYVGKLFYEEKKSKILYFLGEKDKYYIELEDNIKKIEEFIRKKLKK
mgnify:CR=1 FL=1